MAGHTSSIKPITRVLLVGSLAGALFNACSDSTEDQLKAASLSEGCTLNTDCEAPLVCAFKRCHTECETSRDCPEGQRCVASDRPFHVCQLEDERECSRNSECPDRMVCGIDGECRDACVTSRDCVLGQECISRTCVEPRELVDGGLVPAPNVDTNQSRPCVWNSDCVDPEICHEGSCIRECRETRDCAFGDTCVAGRCASSVTEPPPSTTPDAGTPECLYSSDCAGALVCRLGRCVDECVTARDCARDLACVAGSCVAPEGGSNPSGGGGDGGGGPTAGCIYNSDCAAGEICASGACRCECKADRDCVGGHRCDGCGCQPVRPDGAPTEYGSACSLTSDCLFPLVCRDKQCVYECNLTTDCATGLCCYNKQCVTGSVCEPTGDGGSGGGGGCDPCTSNFQCDDGAWCNGQEICWAGCCAPALDTPCNSHSSCILDLCDEQTHECRSETQAPEDFDGDGHLDIGCGGDDCNDDDPTTYLGAPELCDGKDNDCDGYKDEGSRLPFGPLMATSSGTLHDRGAVVPVDLGWISFSGICGANSAALRVGAYALDGTTPIDSWVSGTAGGPSVAQGGVCAIKATSGANRASAAYYIATATSVEQQWVSTWTIDPPVDGGPPTLRHVSSTALNSPVASPTPDPDITWTGTDFVVGYFATSATVGTVARMDADGNVGAGAPVVTVDGTSAIEDRIRVGASGATSAAVYVQKGAATPPLVTIFDAVGGVIAGPIPMPADSGATVLAIAGVSDGYVVAWQDATNGPSTTFVSVAGVVGDTFKITSAATYVGGDGASDGTMAMFSFEGGNAAAYGSTSGKYPLAAANLIANVGHFSNVGGYGTRFAVSGGDTAGLLQAKQIGCLPLP